MTPGAGKPGAVPPRAAMRRITAAEFDKMKQGAVVLSRDEHGEKVLETSDRRIIKLFRRKRLLSSNLWRPYARRFFEAAIELKKRGVPTVEVLDLFRVASIGRDGVTYRKLEGIPLRETLAAQPGRRDELLARLAEFLAKLHRTGAYFRAAHFGNVLVRADGSLALIDVSEATCRRRSLPTSMRLRNFRPLRGYDVDAKALADFGFERFVDHYMDAAGVKKVSRTSFAARALKAMREPPHRKG